MRLGWPTLGVLLDGGRAISGVRTVPQKLGRASALLVKDLEEICQLDRIVASLVHNDGAYGIGLRFILTRVFQQEGARPQLSQIAQDSAPDSSAEGAENLGDGSLTRSRCLCRMLHVDVGHFM